MPALWQPVPSVILALIRWKSAWENELCTECGKEAKEIHDAGREKIWEMLPLFFGLPSWTDLKDFQ